MMKTKKKKEKTMSFFFDDWRESESGKRKDERDGLHPTQMN
jgi:hypothetical protein